MKKHDLFSYLFKWFGNLFLLFSFIIIIIVAVQAFIAYSDFNEKQEFTCNIINSYVNSTILYLNSYLENLLYILTDIKSLEKSMFYLENNDVFNKVRYYKNLSAPNRKNRLPKNIFIRKNNRIIYIIRNNILVDSSVFTIECEYDFKDLNRLFTMLDGINNFDYYITSATDKTILFADKITSIGKFNLQHIISNTRPTIYKNTAGTYVIGVSKNIGNSSRVYF